LADFADAAEMKVEAFTELIDVCVHGKMTVEIYTKISG
jgi:hypothetical protein